MWILCCPETEWVKEIWVVTFLMVLPKDKFALDLRVSKKPFLNKNQIEG
jgi:hypothetical protein